jgi:DEAD/DEAH box helicase domain-containing protein
METIVLDIETEKEFKEVGGKQNMQQLGVTVVGTYAYSTKRAYAYEKHEFGELEPLLQGSGLLIGFNINHFDLPVLQPHVGIDLQKLHVLDLMEDIERSAGFRLSLDNLTRATLGVGKIGYGLDAIWWWRDGLKDKVKEYCLKDVTLTRDLYEFGRERGFVLGDTRDRGRIRIPVRWSDIKPREREAYVQGSLI